MHTRILLGEANISRKTDPLDGKVRNNKTNVKNLANCSNSLS